MKRSFDYKEPPPPRRPLKIYAFDPMIGRRQGGRITIDIPNEPDLLAGPKGKRVSVIDYDGAADVFYASVDLNDSAILMQNGLDPTESDPRFHQQMVYAVAMKVLENFDIALGRRVGFRPSPGTRQLRLFPHAFQGENAFYDPSMKAIHFGYFRADEVDPGPNIPGQYVFTCLSQDIIAHEVTHAIVDRLRRYFREPSNKDVAAFHEGFSDIVAIFQHFTFPDILRKHIRETRGDLRSPNNLIQLASEFGYATGSGKALRSALDPVKHDEAGETKSAKVPDPTLYQTVLEPHERGSILVAAVFDGFFKTYQSRIEDLIRIATGGTGKLPEGDLYPDLVNRIAAEASRTAQSVLNMCIRAFEYLPPIDINFGDYLRALVTADFELTPTDDSGLRANMIEAFRSRGIYPANVASLAEESLLWESNDRLPPLPIYDASGAKANADPNQKRLAEFWLESILKNAYEAGGEKAKEKQKSEEVVSPEKVVSPEGVAPAGGAQDEEVEVSDAIVGILTEYANENAKELHLDPDPNRKIHVEGFHPVFRINPRGQLLVELVAQFTQIDPSFQKDVDRSGGLNLRGGTTVIASANGVVRYVISKPLDFEGLAPEKRVEAKRRREEQEEFVRQLDAVDTNLTWGTKSYYKDRIRKSINFKAVHGSIGR